MKLNYWLVGVVILQIGSVFSAWKSGSPFLGALNATYAVSNVIIVAMQFVGRT